MLIMACVAYWRPREGAETPSPLEIQLRQMYFPWALWTPSGEVSPTLPSARPHGKGPSRRLNCVFS